MIQSLVRKFYQTLFFVCIHACVHMHAHTHIHHSANFIQSLLEAKRVTAFQCVYEASVTLKAKSEKSA